MTLKEVMQKGSEPRPTEGQHTGGPPEGWVPPPNPAEMEENCEKAISSPAKADGENITVNEAKAYKGEVDGMVIKNMTILSDQDNESNVYARGGAKVFVQECVLTKTNGAYVRQVKNDDGSNADELPMLRGINSVVLSNGEGTVVKIKDSYIISECEPGDMSLEASHGAFSVFRGETWLKNVTIKLDGGFAHGVYDTQFGSIFMEDCWVETSGHCASALATDIPGGDIFAKNVVALCHGPASAGIYTDGGSIVEFTDGYLESDVDAGAILCNDGVIKIKNSVVKGEYAARIWQPVEKPGTFECYDSSLISTKNSAFVVDGGFGNIVFDNCKLSAPKDKCILISRRCFNNYDKIGYGYVTIKNSLLVGDIGAVDGCTLDITLENTTVVGASYNIGLTIGFGSKYVFTGDSTLKYLKAKDIHSLSTNGAYTISYNPVESDFSGEYILAGGGKLIPIKQLKG